MIYLIDDKKDRQEKDYGWGNKRFESLKTQIIPIYNLEELEKKSNEVFEDNNVILYHESFLKDTKLANDSLIKREELEARALKHKSFFLVIFSGSKDTREINSNGNLAHLPVSVIYQNLEIFLDKTAEGDISLDYLAFGENPEIENKLSIKIEDSLGRIEKEEMSANLNNSENLFINVDVIDVEKGIKNSTEVYIFNQLSGEEFSKFIMDNLNLNKYDNVFIPMCFGKTLSDYNGLRLATYIRCTISKNQLSRIFIYSPVGMEYLYKDKYFDILKTKNVELVDFSKKAFEVAGNKEFEPMTIEELPKELIKLNLTPLENYNNNHSIKNEWAIYQWTKALGIEKNDELEKNFKVVNVDPYFKCLKIIHPISELKEVQSSLKIEVGSKSKILLVDDEEGKGWFEIFANILDNESIGNKFHFDAIGDGFSKKKPKEIREKTIEKIKKEDIDVVILDFRLAKEDFEEKKIEMITSVQILDLIKEINPGIQVIGFSATDKIWNLQELQSAGRDRGRRGGGQDGGRANAYGIDGFTYKDSGGNIGETIRQFIKQMKSSLAKAKRLKNLSNNFKQLRAFSEDYSEKFKNSVDINLKICFDLYSKSFEEEKYRNYTYLQLFLIIEEFIKEESVFIKEQKCYVNPQDQQILVAKRENGNKYKSAIKYDKRNRLYKIEEYSIDGKFLNQTNYIVSALLIFRFGFLNSNNEDWIRISDNRNQKAAHPGKDIIAYEEINNLVNFLIFFLDISSINLQNSDKGMDKDSNANYSIRDKF